MDVEENDDKPINMLKVQPQIPEEEAIEQQPDRNYSSTI